MNPLSRSMRIVRLAQQQVAIETAADMLEESYDAAGCSSQGQLEKEAETSLNDISFTELVPVTGLDNAILINEPDLEDDVDSFNCYLPNVHAKGNIFTNGNLVTNTPLLSDSDNNVPQSAEANILQPSRPGQKAIADDVSCSEGQDHHNTAPIAIDDDQHPGHSKDKDNTANILQPSQPDQQAIADDVGCSEDKDHHNTAPIVIDDDQHPGHSKDQDKDNTAPGVIEKDKHQGHSEEQDHDNDEDDSVPTTSTSNEAEQTQEGSSKKRKADPKTWKKNINAQKRSRGQAYMGRKYETDSAKFVIVEKPGKVLGERCHCKTSGVKCSEVTDETRAKIHKEVWCMSWPQREILVKSLVHKCNVGRHRVQQSESGRQNTLKYNLNIGSGLVPVCKKMFLSTTGITQHFIRTNVCDTKESGPEEHQPKPSASSSNRTAIKEFLASLATMPAHYCRKSSSKKYIERSFNSKMEVYQEYKNWSKGRQLPIASRQVFVDEFDAGNFAIFRPRKDQCDLCVSYAEGNVSEATYTLHRLRKDMAQKAKEDDKKRASESGDGCILFKLVHDEDWKELIVRGNSTSIKHQPKPLFSSQRQIAAAKFKHLQELKPVIPKDIHGFYDSLPHE
ncbi:hypothetical protein RRG08_043227 [Elysia crispata]|uniref:Uncharacterized protein n=1 Tax=Elysia crispata TaxID=231223 RepID=A0AAE0Y4M4_9GAST|nr:hypothetical protein RRG08_043227 [Elysia crispata]